MLSPRNPRRRRSTVALLCVTLLTDDATAIRACQCCTSSRRRSRLASPRLCDDRQALGDPSTMPWIDEALRQGDVSPQLELGSIPPTISQGIDGLEMLREDELRQLEALEEPAAPMLSPACQELLQRSLNSLDYSGNWSDPARMRDSIVLSCKSPEVLDGPGGPEYSCRYSEFTSERHELHKHIVERMLSSPARTQDAGRMGSGSGSGAFARGVSGWQRGAARGAAKRSLGEQYEEARPVAPTAADVHSVAARELGFAAVQGYEHETGTLSYTGLASLAGQSEEQHVFIVVGVPGSGKDSVLKRYVRSLGMDLLDASADRVKEYLAAYGTDELSVSVREHNLAHGPGKHLLHAQYLHRESVYLIDDIVKRAMTQRRSLLLEKTLFDSGHVLEYARRCRTGSSCPTGWPRGSPSAVTSPRRRRSPRCASTTRTCAASSTPPATARSS